jgi:hypothetical protein
LVGKKLKVVDFWTKRKRGLLLKVHKFQKWFMVFCLAWVSCGVLFAAAEVAMGLVQGVKPFQPTVFTEFFACEGPDPLTGLPLEPVSTFSVSQDAIYVCGYLEAGGPVRLSFVPIYEGKPEGWFVLEEYQPGYVFVEILESRRKRPGHYRVEVHKGRSRLATTEFTIVP